MQLRLSQKDLGKQIAELRKLKGLSQEELAKQVDISRSSMVQVEAGNRSIDIMELQKFSEVLSFSIDDFIV